MNKITYHSQDMMGHAPNAAGHAPNAEIKVFKIMLRETHAIWFLFIKLEGVGKIYYHEISNKIIKYFRVDFFLLFDLNSFSIIIDHNSH